jgi:hypothetical protein
MHSNVVRVNKGSTLSKQQEQFMDKYQGYQGSWFDIQNGRTRCYVEFSNLSKKDATFASILFKADE